MENVNSLYTDVVKDLWSFTTTYISKKKSYLLTIDFIQWLNMSPVDSSVWSNGNLFKELSINPSTNTCQWGENPEIPKPGSSVGKHDNAVIKLTSGLDSTFTDV